MARNTPDPSKPHSRHKAQRPFSVLPAEGCDLPAPPMPRGRRWTEPQRELWAELWASPQATLWEDSYASVVGAYVTHMTAVLAGRAAAWQAQEARHLAERLGLTPTGMATLGWRVAEPGELATVTPIRGAS